MGDVRGTMDGGRSGDARDGLLQTAPDRSGTLGDPRDRSGTLGTARDRSGPLGTARSGPLRRDRSGGTDRSVGTARDRPLGTARDRSGLSCSGRDCLFGRWSSGECCPASQLFAGRAFRYSLKVNQQCYCEVSMYIYAPVAER
jgi:hypothetical protein